MSHMDKKRPERVLVLSGGGGRGAYQVGVCEVLAEKGWAPDVILGNSIGATNGAILAAPRCDGKLHSERHRALDARVADRDRGQQAASGVG